MSDPAHNQVTMLLGAASAGDRKATEALLPLVYHELRQLAQARLARTPPGNTLQATALVHEAYLKLVGGADDQDQAPRWDSRGHFFGAAARAMRNILIDQARHKLSGKGGGGHGRISLEPELHESVAVGRGDSETDGPPALELLALDEAITELERQDPRRAQIVMLKYFAGLNYEQIAAATGSSVPTVTRDWRFAKAWLRDWMETRAGGEQPGQGGGGAAPGHGAGRGEGGV